jgi:hypothetical protein
LIHFLEIIFLDIPSTLSSEKTSYFNSSHDLKNFFQSLKTLNTCPAWYLVLTCPISIIGCVYDALAGITNPKHKIISLYYTRPVKEVKVDFLNTNTYIDVVTPILMVPFSLDSDAFINNFER